MKCPKCNYTSFDYLDSCKKCGKDLSEHKEKHNIRSLLFASTAPAAAAAAATAGDEEFGFDFMEDEEPAAATAGMAAEEKALPVTEAIPEPADDPFGLDEDAGEFSFDDDDTFSFDDD